MREPLNDENYEETPEDDTTLFIKNLNFETTEDNITGVCNFDLNQFCSAPCAIRAFFHFSILKTAVKLLM